MPHMGGIGERKATRKMRRDDFDECARAAHPMHFFHELNHVCHMFHDMTTDDPIKAIRLEWPREYIKVVENIGLSAGVAINTDSAGGLVVATANIEGGFHKIYKVAQ